MADGDSTRVYTGAVVKSFNPDGPYKYITHEEDEGDKGKNIFTFSCLPPEGAEVYDTELLKKFNTNMSGREMLFFDVVNSNEDIGILKNSEKGSIQIISCTFNPDDGGISEFGEDYDPVEIRMNDKECK